MNQRQPNEGLAIARLLMVLSSISPLFILWAIKGNKLIQDTWFISICVFMAVVPGLFLMLRISSAKKNKLTKNLCIGKWEDHRNHLLVYLFAMLLPFYTTDIGTWRDMSAALVALGFIIFLFWHLNLHYMNIIFSFYGFRVFTIYPQDDFNPISGRHSYVLITKRVGLYEGEKLTAFRLSNTVYFESGEQ